MKKRLPLFLDLKNRVVIDRKKKNPTGTTSDVNLKSKRDTTCSHVFFLTWQRCYGVVLELSASGKMGKSRTAAHICVDHSPTARFKRVLLKGSENYNNMLFDVYLSSAPFKNNRTGVTVVLKCRSPFIFLQSLFLLMFLVTRLTCISKLSMGHTVWIRNLTHHITIRECVSTELFFSIAAETWLDSGGRRYLIMAAHSSLYANDTMNEPIGFNSHSRLQ